MTEQEYREKFTAINLALVKKRSELYKDYAFDLIKGKYKIGDIFQDHQGKILITSIRVENPSSLNKNLPSIVFFGMPLKKDGTPKKIAPIRSAFLCNEVKK